MSPSLSSEFFLRPQILHATRPSAPSTIAPPTPTTTPMTVLRVLVDMPEVSVDGSALKPGVEVVVDIDVMVVLTPSLLVAVTSTTEVEITGVGVDEGVLSPALFSVGVTCLLGVV